MRAPGMSVAVLLGCCVTAMGGPLITVPPDLNPGDEYRLVFVTSTTRDASSPNIADYDRHVTMAATAVPALDALGTTWNAIGSTSEPGGSDARDFTNTNPFTWAGVPMYRLDGVRVADDNADLWDGKIDSPISYTELGTDVSTWVWTGTWEDGTSDFPFILGGNPGTGTQTVQTGTTSSTDFDWVATRNPEFYLVSYPLYAISGVLPEPATFSLLALGLLGLRRRRKR